MTNSDPDPDRGSIPPDPQAAFQAASPSPSLLSWAQLHQRHQDERDAWLRATLAALQPHYDRLGPVGVAFRDQLAHMKCGEFIDLDLPSRAAFHAHHLTLGFSNKIYYSQAVLDDVQNLLSSRAHEGIHAIQFGRCAAAHATPYHGGSKIILCPRDGVLLEELKERDAFAKQKLLQNLGDDPGYTTAPRDIMLRDLRASAETILESMPWKQGLTLLDYYRDREIETYESCMMRRYLREPNLVFVRLCADDIWILGGGLGLNSFGDNAVEAARWSTLHPLTPSQHGRIATLNRQLGIADETALPTLRQALLTHGNQPITVFAPLHGP